MSLSRVAIVSCVLATALAATASAQVPAASASSTKVAELATLMQGKKLEAFAIKDARDPAKTDRYVAALLTPKAQLLMVAANYTRFMDIEYRLHNKDFMAAYVDLNTAIFSEERFFIQDLMADGLVAMPKKNMPADVVRFGKDEVTFDGTFADPRRKNQGNKLTREEYDKKFAEADRRYAALLDLMIAELKKMG